MRGTPVLFDSFAGGANFAAAPYEIERNQARDLLNVVGTERGSVKKRPGSVDHVSSGTLVDPHGLFASRALDVFVVSGGGKLQKLTVAGVASDLKTGLDASARWSFVEFQVSGGQGPIFGMNGVNTPQRWDGVAASTSDWTAGSGTVPNGKFMVVAGNRLWVAGVPSDPSGVYFCELIDPRNWPVANVVRFDPNDGGEITGLGRAGPYVVVFKRDKAWTIYNLDTGANRPLGQGVGCVAHRSIAETPIGTLFLSEHGIYSTDGNGVRLVSQLVDPVIKGASAAQVQNAAGWFFDQHYYLSFARSGSDPDRTLDLDMELDSWWLHSNVCGHEWATLDVGSGPELFCAGPSTVLRAFVEGELRDDGAVFLGYWASAFHHFGQPALRKRVRRLHFDGQGYIDVYSAADFRSEDTLEGTADLTGDDGEWEVDDGSLWGVDDGSVFGGSGDVEEAEVYTLGVARAWSFKFGNETAEPFEIHSYTAAINWRKD